MAEEIAMAITGRMKAACSECRSATYPIRVGKERRQKMEQENVDRNGSGSDVGAD